MCTAFPTILSSLVSLPSYYLGSNTTHKSPHSEVFSNLLAPPPFLVCISSAPCASTSLTHIHPVMSETIQLYKATGKSNCVSINPWVPALKSGCNLQNHNYWGWWWQEITSLGLYKTCHNWLMWMLHVSSILFKIYVFWDVVSCHLVSSYQHCGGACCICLQSHRR